MDLLLTIGLSVLVFLGLQLLWLRRARFGRVSWAERVQRDETSLPEVSVDPFALQFVQQRLDVLAGELSRLEQDEAVFAKAFHVRAVESAYRQLLAEAARLSAAYRDGGRAPGTTAVEVEIVRDPTPAREELVGWPVRSG
jgi:hypothetical protein